MEPRKEYETRLALWRKVIADFDQKHRWTGNLRLLWAAGLIVAAVFLRNVVPLGILFSGVIIGIYFSGLIHDRILQRRRAAEQLADFYQKGLDRIDSRWAGKGSPGTEFLDKQHPCAIDLDIFGAGSLFELINTTQTQAGRTCLAQWLLHGAEQNEIAARQAAVGEMRGKVDLREELAKRAADPRAHINTDALLNWAGQPPRASGNGTRWIARCLPFVMLLTLFCIGWRYFAVVVAAQSCFAAVYKKRTAKALAAMTLSARDLWWLSELLGLLETEHFQAPRLKEIQARWERPDGSASGDLRKLARMVDCMDGRENIAVAFLGPIFLLKTQFAFALDTWHATRGPDLPRWLAAVGEMEALSSLACYGYEHPADIFPALGENEGPLLDAQDMGHPLLNENAAVRNSITIDSNCPLHVISGSNMSGKSTWLRTIGTNLVLAMAGAPVRARSFRFTPLQIGASIRTMDSLQEGISRFYAEIKRLRQIVELTGQNRPLIFLIDEVLSGTNSHDRQIGAASIVKALVTKGSIGLITTHDLALTRTVEEVRPPGANFHFEDQLSEGKLTFDYRLRPGVVTKSNALDLMRSIGLDV
jgi:hypothetical protein